jgi:hypothetical protein
MQQSTISALGRARLNRKPGPRGSPPRAGSSIRLYRTAEGRISGNRVASGHVLRRRVKGRARPTNNDRSLLVQMYRWFPSILTVVTIVQPETLVRWHRAGFRYYWRWKSNSRGGRPRIEAELRALIRQMSTENQLHGRRCNYFDYRNWRHNDHPWPDRSLSAVRVDPAPILSAHQVRLSTDLSVNCVPFARRRRRLRQTQSSSW